MVRIDQPIIDSNFCSKFNEVFIVTSVNEIYEFDLNESKMKTKINIIKNSNKYIEEGNKSNLINVEYNELT